MKIQASMDNFEAIMDFVQAEAETAGFENKTVKKVRLACEEMIVNVINYAYPKENKGLIDIDCKYISGSKSFIIKIIDYGKAFNPLVNEEPELNAPIEDRKIGGLGIFLTRKIMDKVEYKRKNNKNILILEKVLASDSKKSGIA